MTGGDTAAAASHVPRLECSSRDGVSWWTDRGLGDAGVVIGFSERGGGTSLAPWASLNLAAHVGDDPGHVDENRARLLDAAGLSAYRDRLVVPDQVHGDHVVEIGSSAAGSGAFAASGRPPVPAADALVTSASGLPLMLCFADCVPIVLVAPRPAVAVVHAGWRGALASIPGKAARELARVAGCDRSRIARIHRSAYRPVSLWRERRNHVAIL